MHTIIAYKHIHTSQNIKYQHNILEVVFNSDVFLLFLAQGVDSEIQHVLGQVIIPTILKFMNGLTEKLITHIYKSGFRV